MNDPNIENDEWLKGSFQITENPALSAVPGDTYHFRGIAFRTANLPRAAQVQNWDVCEGTLLTLGFDTPQGHKLLGSCVMVAPGVALTATHVVDTYIEEIRAQKPVMCCIGVASHGADGWQVRVTTIARQTDICILDLEYIAPLPQDRTFHSAIISTRLPANGERVAVAGFRATRDTFEISALEAQLIVCSGEVIRHLPHGRDRVMAPFPCIEIDCPMWGGMSGGPVFDSRGFVIGLACSSMGAADEPAPMLASLVWPALAHPFDGGWPQEYSKKSLLERAGEACWIDRPSAVQWRYDPVNNVRQAAYTPWT